MSRARLAPVRLEKPVDVIASTLVGAARDKWLGKWCRWLSELVRRFNVEDVQQALGVYSVSDPSSVERLLLEHCRGLTEGECLSKITSMLREQGYRENVTEEMIESMLDFAKTVEHYPEIQYALPSDIVAEIGRLRAHPELDHESAYKLVYEFLTGEGVEHEEADRIAKEIAKSIMRAPPERRKVYYAYAIHNAKQVKHERLDKFMRMEREAREVAEKAKEDMRKDDWIPEVAERLIEDARKNLEKKLRRHLRADEFSRLKQVVYDELQRLYEAGTPRERIKDLWNDLLDFVEQEFFARSRLYAKTKELLKEVLMVRAVKPVARPEERREERPELVKGYNVASPEELGLKLTVARNTRTVEETVKAIKDWAKTWRLDVEETDRIRLSRTALKSLNVVYYPTKKPSLCGVRCLNSICEFMGCDKDVVAWAKVGRTVYIAVYRAKME